MLLITGYLLNYYGSLRTQRYCEPMSKRQFAQKCGNFKCKGLLDQGVATGEGVLRFSSSERAASLESLTRPDAETIFGLAD